MTVESGVGLIHTRAGTGKQILVVDEAVEVGAEIVAADRRLRQVGFGRLNVGIRRAGRARTAAVDVGLEADWVNLGAVEDELPLRQNAGLIDASLAAIDDLKRPPTLGFLAPEVHAHERPIVKV